jgi:hypothetical protein
MYGEFTSLDGTLSFCVALGDLEVPSIVPNFTPIVLIPD